MGTTDVANASTELWGYCQKFTGPRCGFYSCPYWSHATCINHRCMCPGYGNCAVGGRCVNRGGYGGGYGGGGYGARMSVDGHYCMHGWRATWPNGLRTFCRGYCCYHNGRGPFCRVNEY